MPMTLEQARRLAEERLSEKRFQHTLNVCELAVELAN